MTEYINSAAPAQDVAGWIPVTERLPEVAQEVIVSTEFEGVCAGILDSYGEWFAPCSEYKLTRVTHWMPLPAAPANDKQSGVEPWMPRAELAEVRVW